MTRPRLCLGQWEGGCKFVCISETGKLGNDLESKMNSGKNVMKNYQFECIRCEISIME